MSNQNLQMHTKQVEMEKKVQKNKEDHEFSILHVQISKFVQSQLNFAPSHDVETGTFRHSGPIVQNNWKQRENFLQFKKHTELPIITQDNKYITILIYSSLRQFGSTTDFVSYLVGFLIHLSPYFQNCFRFPICRYKNHVCSILTPYSEKFENIS